MYGLMINFIRKCTDQRFIKITTSSCLVAYSIAAWDCPQKLPSLTDHNWFVTMKTQYEARCDGIGQIRNYKHKASSKTSKRRKKNTNTSNEHNPPENEIRIVLIAATDTAKEQAVTCFMPTDKGCSAHVTKRNESILKTLPKIKINSEQYKIDIINMPAKHKVGNELCTALALSSPGPHAILMCIPATEIMDGKFNISAIKPFENKFGDEIYDFVFIVLTKYDEIVHDGSSRSRKEKNLKDEMKHIGKAKINAFRKMENVMNNPIILETKMSIDEKEKKLKEVIKMINKKRINRKEEGKCEFANCQLTQQAETALQEHIKKEKSVGTHSIRDNLKQDKKHLDHVCPINKS